MISTKKLLTKILQRLANTGVTISGSNDSAVSLPTSTAVSVASVTLSPGTWVLLGKIRFSSNTNGYRRANISGTSGDAAQNISVAPVSGTNTDVQISRILTNSATITFHLNAWQNSGATLTVQEGFGTLTAIRIA